MDKFFLIAAYSTPMAITKSSAMSNLKSINGIGKKAAENLYSTGITSKAQAQLATNDELKNAGLTSKQIKAIKDSIQPVLTVNRRSLTGIDVDQLLYDGMNHRFTGQDNEIKIPWDNFGKQTTFIKIDKVLWNTFNAGELYNNMKMNGIDFQDRIVVAEWPKPSGNAKPKKKYVVLEGNRRLRAFRKLRVEEDNISPVIKNQLKNLEVMEIVYKSRDDLLEKAEAMMAVRHLCGTKDWDLFAQAKMIRDTVVRLNSYEAAKAKLGLGTTAIKRRVQAMCLFDELQKQFSSKLTPSTDLSMLLALWGRNVWKDNWLKLSWQEMPPKVTIGDMVNMKHLIRKWKDQPNNDDGGELSGGENSLRPVTRMLGKIDSTNPTHKQVAIEWFEGKISVDDANIRIAPVGNKNLWPVTGKKAEDVISKLTPESLKTQNSEGVKQLESLRKAATTALNNRKVLVTASLAGLTKPQLVELCKERGIDQSGNKTELKKRLTRGM